MRCRATISGLGMLFCLGTILAQSPSHSFSPGAKEQPGAAIKVRMLDSISSKDAKNGQEVRGVVAENAIVEGHSIAEGTPVEATVIATSKAGQLMSAGELSLQLDNVGQTGLISNVTVVLGKEGSKDLPDSAPEVGTDAEVKAESVLTFRIVPIGLASRQAPGDNLDEASAATADAGRNTAQ